MSRQVAALGLVVILLSLVPASAALATPTPPGVFVNHNTKECAVAIHGDDCRCAYSGQADQQQMLGLVRQFPADNLHVVDLPYRPSSWAFDYADNIGLWFDDEQQLVAWAVLQTPFWMIDYGPGWPYLRP